MAGSQLLPLRIRILTLYFCVITLVSGFGSLPPLQGKIIPGIYYEESSHLPILYDKLIPLVFEFRLRPDLYNSFPSSISTGQGQGQGSYPQNLNVNYNKLKLLPRLNCRSDNRSYVSLPPTSSNYGSVPSNSPQDWQFTCPIFYHLHEYLKQYKLNFTDSINPLFRPGLRQSLNSQDSTNSNYQKFSHHNSLQFTDCDYIISRSWKGIYGRDSSSGLADYRSILERCNTLPNYFEDMIQDYNYDSANNPIFDSMRDNFLTNFYLNSTNPNLPDPGNVINNLVSLQNLHLITYLSEINRLREALNSCQNLMIPYAFIKSSRLEKAVQDIKSKLLLAKTTPKYMIPSSLTLNKLLKMPLADCIFSPSSLIIQILVPVARIDTNFQLLKFTAPHFLYKGQLCHVKLTGEPLDFLYDKGTKSLIEYKGLSTKNERELALIPPVSERGLVTKCVYEVLNASYKGIREECGFSCEKLRDEYRSLVLPIIKRVSSSRFVVTLDTISTMLIKCEGKSDELVVPQEYGAVEISLPCSCYIMYHSERFYSSFPCGVSLYVRHVIPEHMVNSSVYSETGRSALKIMIGDPSPNFLKQVNFSLIDQFGQEGSNLEENVTLVDLNLTPNNGGSGDPNNLFLNGSNSQKEECFPTHVFLWVFVVTQTILFLIVGVVFYIKVSELSKKYEYGRSAVCFSVSQMTNLDENK